MTFEALMRKVRLHNPAMQGGGTVSLSAANFKRAMRLAWDKGQQEARRVLRGAMPKSEVADRLMDMFGGGAK